MKPISTICGIPIERADELIRVMAETSNAIKARDGGVTMQDITGVRACLSEAEVSWVIGLLLEAVRRRMR